MLLMLLVFYKDVGETMPVTICDVCGGEFEWCWEEAFYKSGFNDGDGQIETWQVEAVLAEAGYEVTVNEWGVHNTVIVSIRKEGKELIPYEDRDMTFGYDDPREYLPAEIVGLLNENLP